MCGREHSPAGPQVGALSALAPVLAESGIDPRDLQGMDIDELLGALDALAQDATEVAAAVTDLELQARWALISEIYTVTKRALAGAQDKKEREMQ